MTRDASTQTRTILVHLNIEVPDSDERTPAEFVGLISRAISAYTDDSIYREVDIAVAHYEEV